MQHELASIQAEITDSSPAARLAFAARLQRRLSGVNEHLHAIDRSLNAVGMIGDIVSRKVKEECMSLREGMDKRFDELSAILNRALKSSNPAAATESILDSMRRGSFIDMLSSEQDAHVFFLLGRSHYDGKYRGRTDYVRAARFFNAAYAKGCTSAAYFLGNMYFNGFGVKKNYKTSFAYYYDGAQSGGAEAMGSLGWMYQFGLGVELSGQQALKWFDNGAKRGCGLGLWLAGYHFLHGNVSGQNWPKAFQYFERALEAGEQRAGQELRLCYLHGIAADRNPDKAFDLLKRSYERVGDELSAFRLGTSYES